MFEALQRELQQYTPFNEQEQRDKEVILSLLRTTPDIFLRTNLTAHMTASAWVTNPQRTKVLMAYHNIYNSWAWLGGHADGETDLATVALKEVREESGLIAPRLVTPEIYSVEILTVNGHEKRGVYVPSHLHLNLTYLVEADEDEAVHSKADENKAVAWFSPEEALAKSTEPWFVQRVYPKLNEKLKQY